MMASIQQCTIIISFLLLIDDNNIIPGSWAVPITVDDINFNDAWDYKIPSRNEPLLSGKSAVNHVLPPSASRQAKEPDLEEAIVKSIKIENLDPIRRIISCPVCKIGANFLQREAKSQASFAEIKEKFVSICVGFNVQTEPVCSGIFDVYGPELIPVANITNLGPTELCVLLLGESCPDDEQLVGDWNVVFPDIAKPEIDEPPPVPLGAPTFKVLHLADTHLDPDYSAGGPSNCQEPLCCRAYSTTKDSDVIVPAGKWGSLGKCDVPEILIDNMLSEIAKEHPDIDYIIWTGDIPPHDIWNQTKKKNADMFRETMGKLSAAFPNVPIFPALGNHEGVPSGNFPPPWLKHEDHTVSWLYNDAAEEWQKWLPEDVNRTVLHGGFYSVLVRPKFRLISLNTNYCHTYSWWLMLNSTDPAKELQWLIYQLQEAENNGEKVHIIGHIPPGEPDCMKVWSQNFYAIIDRYEGTIAAQFYGHTHADEFAVFYDTNDFQRPTSIAFVAPSVTTYEYHNPGYRIYYVDGDREGSTREVIDHETWVMDLEKANAVDEDPVYYKLYSARKAFGMPDLRPSEWHNLIKRMARKPKLFELFYRFYYKDSPAKPNCDGTCKLQILCDLKSGRSHDRKHLCKDLF